MTDWQSMSVEEYAALELGLGAKVTKQGGVWWRRVRPGFLRSLFPFTVIERDACVVPWRSRWVGFQHPVPSPSSANSEVQYFVFDEVQQYRLEQLEQRYRKNTRKGLSHFDVRPIHDRGEFLSKGFPVYRSFYHRTGYGYRRDRQQQDKFEAWAGPLFDCPKVVILGAYAGDRLRGITVAYLVEDIIISPTYFAETEALRLRVSEAMLHVLRTEVARCQQARYVYMGHVGQSPTLDQYKESRGCKRVACPRSAGSTRLSKACSGFFGRVTTSGLVGAHPQEVAIAPEHRIACVPRKRPRKDNAIPPGRLSAKPVSHDSSPGGL